MSEQTKKRPGGGAKPKGAAKKGGAAAPARKRRKWTLGSTRVKDRSRLSEKMSARTRARLFAQSTVFDFVLVLLVATAVSFTVSYAFHSAAALRGNVFLIIGMTAPVLAAMYVGTWSKRALGPSIVATVLVCAALIVVAGAASPEPMFSEGAVSDTEGNYVIFALVVCVTAVLVFLLSRRTALLVGLLAAVVVACGTVQFLYRDWTVSEPGVPAAVAALFGVGMLFVYQCYKQSIYSANRVKRTSFFGAFAFSALVGAVCVLVGAGVFYGIVQATDWTTPEIKPFEEYVSPPIDENANSYERSDDLNDETSDETNDEETETNQEGAGEQSDQTSEQGSAQGLLANTVIGQMARSITGYDDNTDNMDEQSDQAWNTLVIEAIIFWVLVVLLAVSFVLFWRYRRTLRLKRIAKRSAAYQVWYLYEFLMGRFARLRIRKPANLAPLEFAIGYERAMLPFTRRTEGVDFVELTTLYEDVAFGSYQPTDEELGRMKTYYREFFRNAREYVGWPKWLLWKFWRI